MTDLIPIAEKNVAVIIVNFNGWRHTVECLDALLAQAHRRIHVFVVDNESNDSSLEHIVSWCNDPRPESSWRRHPGVDRFTDQSSNLPLAHRLVDSSDGVPLAQVDHRLTLISAGRNGGFAAGCNIGIRAAGIRNFDYFWFLNADAVVHRDALKELLGRAVRGTRTGMVGSTIRYYDSPQVLQAMGGARLNRSNGMPGHIGEGAQLRDVPTDVSGIERELDYIMGASMLVSAQYIAEIGVMTEDYFLYFEDADWGLRGAGKFSLGFAPRSYVFHKWGMTSHKALPSLSSRYYYRNRLLFVSRFLPARLGAAKRLLFEQMLRHVARGRWGEARVVFSTLMTAKSISPAPVRTPN